jgi:hypothetical protein
MENVDGGRSGAMIQQSPYLRKDDPHFPCNALTEEYLSPCYFFQASQMYDVLGGDFAAIARECGTVPDSAQHACFQSMGRAVSGHLRGQPRRAIEMCGLISASPHRSGCLEQVVLNWFSGTSGAEVALEFCGLVESDAAFSCYYAIAWQASEVYSEPESYTRFCGAFKSDYLWLCDMVKQQKASERAPTNPRP